MYFIWGEDQYIIDQNKKNIIKKIDGKAIVFDESNSINDVIEEIDTISLFNEHKVVVMNNLSILKSKNIKEIDDFLICIKNTNVNLTLIFTWTTKKLPKNNAIIDFLLKKYIIVESSKPSTKNFVSLIQEIVNKKKGTITNKAALQMGLILPNDLYIINNEIDILLLRHKNISLEEVNKFVSMYPKSNGFELSNAIISGDNQNIMESYLDQIQNNCEPLMIMSQLASNYEAAYLIKLYIKLGYKNYDIAEMTSINIYKINKLRTIINNESTKTISSLINKLAKLDEDIKNGLIEKTIGLDKFIFHVIRNNKKV